MKKLFNFKLLVLLGVMVMSINTAWASGYNSQTFVYLRTNNGTTYYYQVSAASEFTVSATLPDSWGGILKDQTISNVQYLQLKGGAVGGWTSYGDGLSGTLYYKVTNNTTTPSDGWTSLGSISSGGYVYQDNSDHCYYYKNDYSTNITPHTPGTYYLHIKITDGASNNRTSYVQIVVPPFTVAGSSAVLGSDWAFDDTNNDMSWSTGTTYTLTKSNVTLATGTTYECKVGINHGSSEAYPASNKQFTIAADGHYNVTFTFDASSHAVDVSTTRLYAVIYNDNGKTSGSVPATSYHASGATVTVASNSGSLAKTGYNFGGWNTNSSGTGSNYAAGSGTFTMSSADKDLYAKWTAKQTTVTLNANAPDGETVTGGGTTVTATYNSSLPSFDALTCTGDYALTGYWDDDEGGNKIINADGSFAANGGTWNRLDGNTLDLYAQWSLDRTLTYDGNGETSGNVPASATTYDDGTEVTVLGNVDASPLVKTGYTFTGWNTATGGSGDGYSAGDKITMDDNYTLYAQWTANSYEVEFKANGGSGSMSNQDFTYDAAQSLTSVNYTRAGYTFGGWATSKANADAGTKAYDDGESVSNLTSTDGATVELWAIWTARPYKIVCIVKPTSWTNVYAYAYKDNGGSAAIKYNATWPGIRLDNDLQGTGLTASNEDACNTYYYKFYTDGGASDAEGNGTAVGGAASAWDKVIFNNGDNPGSEGSTKTRSLNINASNGTTRYYLLTDAAAATGAASAYASEWYLRGNFNGTDEWSSWSYPLSMNCATSTGYVVMSSLSSSNVQYFRIYDISTGNIFKYTGGASAVYDADYDISSEIGTSLTMRSYGTTGANKFTPESTTDYRFTLNTTNPMNPVLVVAPDNDEDYTVSSGLYDGTPDGCSVTEITELHQYTPTSLTATAAPGYRFKQWRYTGCSLAAGSTATSNPASFTATANGGKIEAEFTNEGFVYLDKSAIKNSWGGTPYVYFYSSSYWDKDGKGSGSDKDGSITVYGPYAMSRIGDSQIWYYDYSSSVGMANTKNYIAFNDHSQYDYDNFVACLAIYRGDFYQKQNMFVAKDYKYYYNTGAAAGQAVYYNDGYWRKYNETDPGYVVKTYNAWGGADCTGTYRFSSSERGARNCTVDVPLNSGPNYFKVVGCDTIDINSVEYSGTFYRDEYGAGTMSSDNSTNWLLVDKSGSNTGVHATASGDYKFTLTLGEGNLYISVDFPMSVGDFRLMYNGKMRTTYVAKKKHESNFIRKLKAPVVATDTLKRDTVSFFIDPSKDNGSLAPSLGFQWCSKIVGYTVTWRDTLPSISLSSIDKAGVYDFVITQTNTQSGTHTISCALKGAYEGNYYIRTNAAAGAWKTYKESADNMLNYSDYSKAHSGYDYYYCNWVGTNENVKFTIANDYSECVTDTVEGDDYVPTSGDNVGKLPYEASVRFMMDSKTNAIWRAYLNGSNEGTADYLKIESNPARTSTDSETKTDNAEIIDSNGSTFTNNSVKFKDLGNWVYQIDLKVLEAARIKLVSNYYFSSTNHEQYFKGKSGDWADANTEEILGGSENAYRDLRIVYDYKTNHLISAWLVTDDQITGGTAKAINTDLMILRKDQGDAKQITFSSGTSLTAVDTVYSVMQFSFNHIANKEKSDNTTDSTLSIYEREYYWVSFPYDVKINDIFGSLGDFNNEWGIMYYDGKERAKKGYWSDSKGFWKYFPDQSGTLKAFEGYVLGVDVGLVGTALNTGKWKNTVRDVYLYFPSSRKINSIVQKDTTISIDQTDYQCTIDRTGNNGSDINKNRTIADSYWHVIGAPSFKNVSHTTGSSWQDTDADSKVDLPNLSDWSTTDVPFLYEWSKATNTYTPMTSSSYTFKPMYSYMVQYNKPTITWSSVTAPIPPASVAARSLAENGDVEWRIDLLLGTDSQDRTYVRMSNDEAVTAGFEFNYDLTKEYNKSKANIYTFASYVPVAGNIMPMNTINTTVIPMGVKITTNGEYTFTLPEGMNGIGITLVDNIKNTRTNLALTDYTVELTKGTYDDRFTLEISPISQTPTDVRTIGNEGSESGVRKVIVDGLLYIVKEGVAYDARGNRVK